MSKILRTLIFICCLHCSESELRLGFYHDNIGCLCCSNADCDNHVSTAQYNRAVTKPSLATASLFHGGWHSLRLKGGSARNSKRQESVKKSFQEKSETVFVESPPAENAEDEGTTLQ